MSMKMSANLELPKTYVRRIMKVNGDVHSVAMVRCCFFLLISVIVFCNHVQYIYLIRFLHFDCFQDSVQALSAATEYFISDLAQDSHSIALINNRKTIKVDYHFL